MLNKKDFLEASRQFKDKKKNPHQRQRYHALLLITKGYTYCETADILFINEQTVSRWVNLYQSKGLDGLKNNSCWGGEHGQTSLKTDSTLETALEKLLVNEMAGDPMSEQKWVRCSGAYLATRLKELGHSVSRNRVYKSLRKMGFSLKRNNKKKYDKSNGPEQHDQFQYIASQRQLFITAGLPIISVDTKKKELIGNFSNKGKVWCKKAEEVYKYDFTSQAICRAVPYGIYDLTKNNGFVYVGTSGDTPEFAAGAIAKWWQEEGCISHPRRKKLLILADGGGSNGYRVQAWKQQIQEKLCDQLGLTVTVCHYPPGCSKWNPVEYRLFSFISINWAGVPLRSLDIMLGYIRGTSNKTGLTVKAFLQRGRYKGGQKVTKEEMERLNIKLHTVCPKWNYTIIPHTS